MELINRFKIFKILKHLFVVMTSCCSFKIFNYSYFLGINIFLRIRNSKFLKFKHFLTFLNKIFYINVTTKTKLL